jgi:hypothetical protein
MRPEAVRKWVERDRFMPFEFNSREGIAVQAQGNDRSCLGTDYYIDSLRQFIVTAGG